MRQRKERTPRTDLIGSILLNIGCVLLLMNGVDMGLDKTYVVLMGAFTGACIFKTISAVWRFKKLTGHWPNLKYDGLLKPEGD